MPTLPRAKPEPRAVGYGLIASRCRRGNGGRPRRGGSGSRQGGRRLGPQYRKAAAMKRAKTVRTLRFAIGTAVHKLLQSPNGSEIAQTRLGVKRSQVQVLSPRLAVTAGEKRIERNLPMVGRAFGMVEIGTPTW